jgi:two-component system, cell cycle sensor histidine kinase and response regulator CckA
MEGGPLDSGGGGSTDPTAWLHRLLGVGGVLGRSKSVSEALNASVDALLVVPGVDSCAVYLADDDGSLKLAAHRGVENGAAVGGARHESGSTQARLVQEKTAVYVDGAQAWLGRGVLAVALVPVVASEVAIGCLHIGSQTQAMFPSLACAALENVASCLGSTLARIRAKEARQESEDAYRFLTDNIKDVLWSMDFETLRFLYVSPSVKALRGFTPEEVMAQPLDAALPPDAVAAIRALLHDRLVCYKAGERVDGQRQFFTEELPQPRKDGSLVWTEVVTTFCPNPKTGRLEVHGVSRDITARRAAEEEKRNLQEQLAQAHKLESIGRLAGGIAHDFNNMLTIIFAETEIALLSLSAPDDPKTLAFESIKRAAQRSADLTRQLLAFARKQSVVPQVLDLNHLIGGMLGMLRRLLREDIKLDWKPGTALLPVRVDSAQINQIVANLCVNARDAIEGAGVITLETSTVTLDQARSAELPDSRPGAFIVLAVTDTGQGMSEDVQRHIFEPFFTTKAPGQGTGLGLVTVYGIIRQNGGFLSVHSQPGRGATFRVHFPVSLGVIADEEASSPVEATGKGNIVLLVEDDAAVLQVSRTMIERLGYTVLAAGSPDEALRLAAAYSGDLHLLVTDVVMPGLSGKDLFARLKQSRPWLRCLYMSGYADGLGDGAGILDQDANLLEKPYTLRSLAEKLRDAMSSSRRCTRKHPP